jgi:hypothetical protein
VLEAESANFAVLVSVWLCKPLHGPSQAKRQPAYSAKFHAERAKIFRTHAHFGIYIGANWSYFGIINRPIEPKLLQITGEMDGGLF